MRGVTKESHILTREIDLDEDFFVKGILVTNRSPNQLHYTVCRLEVSFSYAKLEDLLYVS